MCFVRCKIYYYILLCLVVSVILNLQPAAYSKQLQPVRAPQQSSLFYCPLSILEEGIVFEAHGGGMSRSEEDWEMPFSLKDVERGIIKVNLFWADSDVDLGLRLELESGGLVISDKAHTNSEVTRVDLSQQRLKKIVVFSSAGLSISSKYYLRCLLKTERQPPSSRETFTFEQLELESRKGKECLPNVPHWWLLDLSRSDFSEFNRVPGTLQVTLKTHKQPEQIAQFDLRIYEFSKDKPGKLRKTELVSPASVLKKECLLDVVSPQKLLIRLTYKGKKDQAAYNLWCEFFAQSDSSQATEWRAPNMAAGTLIPGRVFSLKKLNKIWTRNLIGASYFGSKTEEVELFDPGILWINAELKGISESPAEKFIDISLLEPKAGSMRKLKIETQPKGFWRTAKPIDYGGTYKIKVECKERRGLVTYSLKHRLAKNWKPQERNELKTQGASQVGYFQNRSDWWKLNIESSGVHQISVNWKSPEAHLDIDVYKEQNGQKVFHARAEAQREKTGKRENFSSLPSSDKGEIAFQRSCVFEAKEGKYFVKVSANSRFEGTCQYHILHHAGTITQGLSPRLLEGRIHPLLNNKYLIEAEGLAQLVIQLLDYSSEGIEIGKDIEVIEENLKLEFELTGYGRYRELVFPLSEGLHSLNVKPMMSDYSQGQEIRYILQRGTWLQSTSFGANDEFCNAESVSLEKGGGVKAIGAVGYSTDRVDCWQFHIPDDVKPTVKIDPVNFDKLHWEVYSAMGKLLSDWQIGQFASDKELSGFFYVLVIALKPGSSKEEYSLLCNLGSESVLKTVKVESEE